MTKKQINIAIAGGTTLTATLSDNSSAIALLKLLEAGPFNVDMHDYANMEKVGSLPESLPRNDTYFSTEPGDLVLYLGNQFVIYYDNNSYNFTRLGKINGNYTGPQLKSILGDSNVTVTLSTAGSSGTNDIATEIDSPDNNTFYTLSGQRVSEKDNLLKGVYIVKSAKGAKKIIL